MRFTSEFVSDSIRLARFVVLASSLTPADLYTYLRRSDDTGAKRKVGTYEQTNTGNKLKALKALGKWCRVDGHHVCGKVTMISIR